MSWADSSGSPRRSPVQRGGPASLAVSGAVGRSSSPSAWADRASSSVLGGSPRTPPARTGRSSPPQTAKDSVVVSLTLDANGQSGAEASSSLENQQLLSGLVEAQRLAPAIKTVIDRSWQGSFHSMLEAHVERKNQEIKNICNRHYEEFISSIDHLITVKTDLTELKGMLAQHNQGVQDSGAALLENARRLVEYRVIRRNIDQALEVCAKCNYIVSLAIKAQSQIVDKKYFSALKTLDQLQRLHLPRFSDYEFAHLLEQQLPLMILRIKEDVRGEFSSWHSSIRQRSQDKDLGAAAMTQVYEQLQLEDQKKEAQRKDRAKRLGRGLQMGELDEKDFDDDEPIRPSRDRAGSDPPDEDPDDPVAARGSVKVSAANGADSLDDKGLFERLGIDFAPVYQCLHIYENLNIGAQFQQYYRDSRRAHALQAVELPPMSSAEFISQYTPYFAQLAGFFIIEDNIMKSGNELMTRQQVDSLWDLAVTKIKVVLREHFGYLTDPIVFNQVKYMAVLFCKTLESYGYNPTLLLEFLADQRAAFEAILMQRLQREVLQILEAEKFESMPINTSAEYEKLVLNYHLQDRAMPIHLPARMPFSVSVPQICRQIRIFVADYFEFAAHLNADMDGAIRKAVDDALINVVNGAMSHAIDQSAQLHISQAVQFSINAAFLVEACSFFETHTLSYLDTRYPKSFRLQARTVFQQTRMRCEDLLYELIDNKIDTFMSLAVNFKWNPNQPQNEASEYIQDLVAYLETTFACLSFMPPNVRDAVHFTSCKHIAGSLMNQMAGPAVKTFNVIAIYNLHQDLQLLENFAQRCNSPNLIESFSEPRQLVNLFLSGNVEQMLDQHVRSTRFQNLSLSRLTKIMDKYRDIGMFATMPLAIKKLKAKQVEVVSKQLKMLMEG